MPECFCGCGQRTRIGARSINRIGTAVDDGSATVRCLLRAGMQSPRGEEFVRVARQLRAQLSRTVHTGGRPDHDLAERARELAEFGRTYFGVEAVVEAVGRSGLSTAEAARALERGEFDPYADVPSLPVALPQEVA